MDFGILISKILTFSRCLNYTFPNSLSTWAEERSWLPCPLDSVEESNASCSYIDLLIGELHFSSPRMTLVHKYGSSLTWLVGRWFHEMDPYGGFLQCVLTFNQVHFNFFVERCYTHYSIVWNYSHVIVWYRFLVLMFFQFMCMCHLIVHVIVFCSLFEYSRDCNSFTFESSYVHLGNLDFYLSPLIIQ